MLIRRPEPVSTGDPGDPRDCISRTAISPAVALSKRVKGPHLSVGSTPTKTGADRSDQTSSRAVCGRGTPVRRARQQVVHNQAVATFPTTKFGTPQLYQGMSASCQACTWICILYTMAHDLARQAERAFRFACSLAEGGSSYLRPVPSEEQRNGLLAGEALSVDLERP